VAPSVIGESDDLAYAERMVAAARDSTPGAPGLPPGP
jgi:hypothetical protein